MAKSRSLLFSYVPVGVLFLTVALLLFANTAFVYEPRFFLPVLNTFFLGIIPFGISALFAVSYLRHGTLPLLWLGSGLLAIGVGSVVGGWGLVIFGQDFAVTMHNCGCLVGGLCHLVGAHLSSVGAKAEGKLRGSRSRLAAIYGVSLLSLVAIAIADGLGCFPPFFGPGGVPSALRQLLLSTAVLVFIAAAILIARFRRRKGYNFFDFYFIGLALIALGLVAVLFERQFGNVLSWLGRACQYIAFVFLSFGAFTLLKESGSIESRASDFLAWLFEGAIDRRVRHATEELRRGLEANAALVSGIHDRDARVAALLDHSTDAIMLSSPDGRIFTANPAACAMFQRSEAEIVALGRDDLFDPSDPRLAAALREREEKGWFRGMLSQKRKDGSVFPCEVSSTIFRDSSGEIRTSISLRDMTKQVETQANLERRSWELESAIAELRSLTSYMFKAREEERRKVALEIHDEMGQMLTAMNLGLHVAMDKEWADQAGLRAHLERLAAINKDAIASVQSLVSVLRPKILDDMGLKAAVEWLAFNFGKMNGPRIALAYDVEEEDLDPEARTAIFRLVQESLSNVLRHAQAGRIGISLSDEGGTIAIDIEDDGVGIDDDARTSPSSFGIIGMRERVRALGGIFSVRRGGEGGTKVEIRLSRAAMRDRTAV